MQNDTPLETAAEREDRIPRPVVTWQAILLLANAAALAATLAATGVYRTDTLSRLVAALA